MSTTLADATPLGGGACPTIAIPCSPALALDDSKCAARCSDGEWNGERLGKCDAGTDFFGDHVWTCMAVCRSCTASEPLVQRKRRYAPRKSARTGETSCSAVDSALVHRMTQHLQHRFARHHAKLGGRSHCSRPTGELKVTVAALQAAGRVRVSLHYEMMSLKSPGARSESPLPCPSRSEPAVSS